MGQATEPALLGQPTRHSIQHLLLGQVGVLGRLVRYGGVSAIATATSFATLAVLVGALGFPAGWSAMAASCAGMIPAFQLNRRWVWGQGGRASVRAEVLPYAAMAIFGMGLSSLASHLAGLVTAGWPRLARTATVEAASLSAYGTLWLAEFAILDRLLWPRDRSRGTSALPQRRRPAGSVRGSLSMPDRISARLAFGFRHAMPERPHRC